MTERIIDMPDECLYEWQDVYYPDERDDPMPVRERIVRCRDCDHMSECHYRDMLGFGREMIVYRCDYFWNVDELPEVEPDGFCAWGEQRGDA